MKAGLIPLVVVTVAIKLSAQNLPANGDFGTGDLTTGHTPALLQSTNDPGNDTLSQDAVLHGVQVLNMPDSGSCLTLMALAVLGLRGFAQKKPRR